MQKANHLDDRRKDAEDDAARLALKIIDTSVEKKKTGKIIFITGPMFSGKTSRLIAEVEKYGRRNKKWIVIKHKDDLRKGNKNDENTLYTHGFSKILAKPCGELPNVSFFKKYDVVAIDEGQFFTGLQKLCNELATRGCIVIVSALKGKFNLKPWEEVEKLRPSVDNEIILSAVCDKCGKKAPFSAKRLYNILTGEKLSETGEEYIGSEESYLALCRNCYCNSDDIEKN